MKARCVTCEQMVETDEWKRELDAFGSKIKIQICNCPGGRACQGDDYTEDHRLDDPRHGQADSINAENRRRR